MKFDRNSKTVDRRIRVIKRLENQLLTGFKTVSDDTGAITTVKLTDSDISRIKKELETLNSRL